MKYIMDKASPGRVYFVTDTTNWEGFEEVTVIRHVGSNFDWRDAFMALVNRTQSGELHITDEEIERAARTDNAMIMRPGKIIIQAGGLRMPWPDESTAEPFYK